MSVDPARQIWDAMLGQLRLGHPEICRHWFAELESLSLVGGRLKIRAHSAVHRDYLRRQCADAFNDAARAASGHLVSVEFVGPDDAPDHPGLNGSHAPAEPAPRPALSTGGSLVINPDYHFDNFVVGPNNRLAHAAAVAVASQPGRHYNPLFIHGDVGLGKTHLLQAVCLRVLERSPDTRIHYTSCEAFKTQFMEAVQAGAMSEFRHRFRDVDILVIDDIHFLATLGRTQEEFFHTFNSLYQAQKQIVLSSDAPPEEIPDLEDRLVSRFKWGLVTQVDRPDYETRVEIVANKARLRGLQLPPEVAAYIAQKIETNIRELEGAVVKLQALSTFESRPIDVNLARQSVGDTAPAADRQVQIQTIIDAVTDFYGVRATDLQSKRRHRSVAQPRQLCMYLARKFTRFSLDEIGGYFGGRDHTTVLHAIRMIESRSGEDPDFGVVVRTFEDRLREQAR